MKKVTDSPKSIIPLEYLLGVGMGLIVSYLPPFVDASICLVLLGCVLLDCCRVILHIFREANSDKGDEQ